MRSLVPILFLAVAMCVGIADAGERPTLVRVEVGDRNEAREVGKILNLDEKTRGNTLFGWGTVKEIEAVERLGFLVEVVPPGPKDIEALTMCGEPFATPFPWNCYPTWSQFETMMQYYATTYSDIVRLVNLGMSGEGDHELWALKISDNPDTEENEPEVFYTGTMHGDELVCYGTTVHLIDHILTNYGSDTQIDRLVDGVVLWFNPLSNPDGTFAGGDHTVASSQRYLPASGLDANRNFPDPSVPNDPTSPGWATEIQHMIDLADAEHFTISANCHGGAELFNYPWDMWTVRTPDDAWWIDAGVSYATSAQNASPGGYFTDDGSGFDMPGVTNGANWYVTNGNRQDFMNWYHGCREVTLELSGAKQLGAEYLDVHFDYNRQALLDYFELALTGIRGIVTDAVTGLPLNAEVRVLGHDIESHRSWVTTDPDIGDYHRLIEAGTYDLAVSAPGYESATVNGVVVAAGSDATVRDVLLAPLPRYTVTGIVTNAETAASVQGAAVTLVGTTVAPATTGSTGGYSIAGVWADTYTFRVEAPGYGIVESNLVVGPGATTHDFTLTGIVTVFETDLETDIGGLSAPEGWAWGSDTTVGAHSGTKVWGTELGGDYSSNALWALTTPSISLPVADGAELRFWQWYAIESGYDGGNIKVAGDGGSFNLVTPSPSYNDQTIAAFGDNPGFTGSAGWHEVVVDLTPFVGQSVEIRWTLGTDINLVDLGWYLDDVAVAAWGAAAAGMIFSDGFESANTDGWDTAVGGAASRVR